MPTSTEREIKGHPWRKVLLALSAVMLAMAVGELVVRLSRLAPKIKAIQVVGQDCVYQRSTNPILGFELKAGYRNANPDFIESYEYTNSHGQRDRERSLVPDETVRRVLVLGDSVVEGYGLSFDETIPSQLQSFYDKASDAVEVLNFGVSAYCTLAEIELLETKGIQFAPDVVVLVFVENDFDNFNREAFPLGQSVSRPAVVESLFRRSHLFRLTSINLNLFGFRQSDPVKWNHEAIGDNNVAAGLERFRKLADEYKFRPLIAIWPRFTDREIVDPLPLPESDSLIVEALAEKYQLPTVRISNHFRGQAKSAMSPRFEFTQGDELHPNAKGAFIAADAIRIALANKSSPPTQTPVDVAVIEAAIQALPQTAPNYSRVYNRIANELLADGNVEEAIERYKKSLQEDPNNSATHNNLAIALQRRAAGDDRPRARGHFEKALANQPDFAEAHFNLAGLLDEEAGTRDLAQQHFIQAIKIQPTFTAAHFGLSRSLLRSERPTAAEAGFREALRLDNDHLPALRQLASLLAKQNRYVESRDLFERVVRLDSQDAESLNNLAAMCANLGDRKAAIQYLEAAITADPSHPTAAGSLGKLRGNP